MPPFEFLKLSKVYAENVSIAFNPEVFAMSLASGESSAVYAISPGHMKRLAQYTAHQVKAFEEQFGPIAGPDWSPNSPSPIQPPDLKK